jgi:hypothetical protein
MEHSLTHRMGQIVAEIVTAKVAFESLTVIGFDRTGYNRVVSHLENAERLLMEIADMLEDMPSNLAGLSNSERDRL